MKQMDFREHYPVPDYIEKLAMFDDLATCRVMLLAKWGDELWLFYWHKHRKNWVSLRSATPADLKAIQAEIDGGRSVASTRGSK